MKKNEMTIFSNDEFGKIRTVVIDHDPWFVAVDVAKALGYSNPRDATAKHVDEEDKRFLAYSECATVGKGEPSQNATVGNERASQNATVERTAQNLMVNLTTKNGVNIINESGLYALIFGSHLPKARAFKRWVTSDVLPTLRKKGYYAIKPKKDDGWGKKMEKRTKDFIEYWFIETADYYEHVVGITSVAHLSDYMLNELYCAHANRLARAFCEFVSFSRAKFRAAIADPTLLMPVKERNKLLRKQGKL